MVVGCVSRLVIPSFVCRVISCLVYKRDKCVPPKKSGTLIPPVWDRWPS